MYAPPSSTFLAMTVEDTKQKLFALITKHVVLRGEEGANIFYQGIRANWLFDFRTVLLSPSFLDAAADFFWDTFKDRYPFQVGGLETAGIPLVAAIVMRGIERGTPVRGFYIRKSRKPEGAQKIIEGELGDEPVILVDDLINRGSSFIKQIDILKREGRKPIALFAFVRFRNIEDYAFAARDDMEIVAPFALQDFNLALGDAKKLADSDAFDVRWVTRSPHPAYFYRSSKSGPVLDAANVYVGSDDGVMHAYDQESGGEQWRFKILGFGSRGRTIFATPVLHDGMLYFGAYDGNFYALNAATGKQQWIYMDADWIHSSPAVAPDLGIVFVGLQYGLWNKKGGVVALAAKTGKKQWEYADMPASVRAAPAYSRTHGVVIVGSSDGTVYCFRARTGELLWSYKTDGAIEGSFAFDEERGRVFFGGAGGLVHVVDVRNGHAVRVVPTGSGVGIWSTPCVHGDHVYISSPDKRMYCFNLETLELVWTFVTDGRVFASPIIANRLVYVGSNDGRLYELDAHTGRNIAFFQTSERITNAVAYNEKTKRFFVPTYANELYCVERHER